MTLCTPWPWGGSGDLVTPFRTLCFELDDWCCFFRCMTPGVGWKYLHLDIEREHGKGAVARFWPRLCQRSDRYRDGVECWEGEP